MLRSVLANGLFHKPKGIEPSDCARKSCLDSERPFDTFTFADISGKRELHSAPCSSSQGVLGLPNANFVSRVGNDPDYPRGAGCLSLFCVSLRKKNSLCPGSLAIAALKLGAAAPRSSTEGANALRRPPSRGGSRGLRPRRLRPATSSGPSVTGLG